MTCITITIGNLNLCIITRTIRVTIIIIGMKIVIIPTDAACCPDIRIENVVLSNI